MLLLTMPEIIAKMVRHLPDTGVGKRAYGVECTHKPKIKGRVCVCVCVCVCPTCVSVSVP